MQALQFFEHGEPAEVIKVTSAEAVPLSQNQVRVRMIAAPVNPSDVGYIRGTYGTSAASLPAIPGFEGVGTVVEGRGLLGRMLVGKRVATLASDGGTWAEETVIDARKAIPVSASISDDQAAMFFVNPATAYILTKRVAQLKSGDWILQSGGSSQVGKMIIRLGQQFGFRTASIVRNQRHVESLKTLGADAVIVHDPERDSAQTFESELKDQTRGAAIARAVDCVGGIVGSRMLSALGNGGRLTVYGTMSGEPLSFSPRVLMSQDRSIGGFWLGPWMNQTSLIAKLKLIRTLTKLHEAGLFHTEIARRIPFSRFGAEVNSKSDGKILVQPG